MRTQVIIIAVFGILAFALLSVRYAPTPDVSSLPQETYKDQKLVTSTPYPTPNFEGYTSEYRDIEGETKHLLVAETTVKQALGLMYVTELEDYDGMVFVFPDKAPRSFWNKNTLVDLDIYWYNDTELVGTSKLPSITSSKDIVTVTSPKPANIVVELLPKK